MSTMLASAPPSGAEPAPEALRASAFSPAPASAPAPVYAPAFTPAPAPAPAPAPPHFVRVVREAPVVEPSVGSSCVRGAAGAFIFFAIFSVVAGFFEAAGVPCAGPLAAGVAGGVIGGGQTAMHNRRARARRSE
jgi:hypothetical protein